MMTMEGSSNSRDELSSSSTIASLQLSVEQWELLRRLRNSHLTKGQIIRAYDELDRLDRELGNLFNSAPPPLPTLSSSSTIDPVSPSIIMSQQISPPSSASITNNNKRSHNHMVNGLPPIRPSNGYHSSHVHHSTTSSNGSLRALRNSVNETNSVSTNQHDTINPNELEEETRELQDLLAKGDVAIHNEISVFVYRYDLKQSQIARMAAVNQAYVSKFLRGDIFDLSENGRLAICRWYLRYKKIVQCMGGVPSSTELLTNLTSSCEPPTKVPRLVESQTNNNASPVSFDAPKRTRFTFRPEHLDILEKAFTDNPYPDPRRREDIARMCNEARTRIDGTNDVLNERDRVTDAIVTHWFQNKRKMTKSQRVSIQEDSIPLNISNNSNNHPSTLTSNDFENINGDDDIHIHHHHHQQQQQKSTIPIVDIDCFDKTSSSLLDPQMAAYRAIMSRMVPFANNINGNSSPKRFVKQEPILNQDESSDEDESNSQSPLNDHLSP